ncbi:MAG: sialidase family protein [Blastocatellales bacterium]
MKIMIIGLLIAISLPGAYQAQTAEQKHIVSVVRIWDRAPHNAFTDLVEFKGSLYCTFREGSGHVPGRQGYDGTIRIIRSDDGMNWRSVALLEEDSVDLRDPKLSVTPDGRLMVLMGGSVYHGAELKGYSSRVSFSDRTGSRFSKPIPVELDASIRTGRDWLWRVTWSGGRGYGVVYQSTGAGPETVLRLVVTGDGRRYRHLTTLDVPDRPNETTLRFTSDGEMIAWVRREAGNGRLGFSRPPYKEWSWVEQSIRLGGPNFIRLDDGRLIGATRGHLPEKRSTTMIVALDREGGTSPIVTLPSGGDTSYPGMVLKNGKLLVSYYSSHEGRTAIYLAVIRLP